MSHSDRRENARIGAILTLVAAVAFIAFSAAAPEFRGYTIDQMPFARPDPAVQPAGYAFAIWGVIYGWLLVSAGFGLLRRAEAPDWQPHRWPLIVAMGLGAGWLWVAVQSPVAATAMIFAMLAGALTGLLRSPQGDYWLARAPIGLFAGWLTAASFVSLGVTLSGYGLIASDRLAAMTMIVLAAATAAMVVWRLAGAGAYAFAVGWGLAGIAAANAGRDSPVMALALIAALALAALWWWRRSSRS